MPFVHEPARGDSGPTSPAPARLPVWVKRGDVHNTQEGDVVFAETDARGRGRARPASRARGIARRGAAAARGRRSHQVLRRRPGGGGPDGGPPWFRWFYHKDQTPGRASLRPAAGSRASRGDAAAALGLEIYGGDAIATADGGLLLLDLNAWPSFALYRDEAAPVIAAYLALRFGARRTAGGGR